MRKRPSSASMSKLDLGLDQDPTAHTPPLLRRIMTSTLFPLLAALYYISTSVSLTLFNKILFALFPASDPAFLLLAQSLTAITILSVLSLSDKFSIPKIHHWPLSSWSTYAPLYISNLAMLLTSLIALKFTSLLMYNTLRRTSMIFVVTIHCLLHKTLPPAHTVAATTLVTVGALIASRTDLAFDPLGYTLAFSANISTAIYLVFLRPVRDKLQLSNLQLIFVNALANIPILVLIMLIVPPDHGFLHNFSNTVFTILFVCSCSIAVVINHAIFVNTTTNDAIAQSIASQLKDVVLLIISIVFIDDPAQRAAGNLQGVFVGFLGSLVYGIGKLRERKATKIAEQAKQEALRSDIDPSSERTSLMDPDLRQST